MNVPDRIANAARARVAAMSEQRERSLKAIAAGCPLDAEPDPSRRVRRVQAVTGKPLGDTMRFAAGPLTAGEEKIQGMTADFVPVSFLDLARLAASTVCRIVFRNQLRPQGSGFLISERLLLTNNHVIPTAADAADMLVELNYEMTADNRPKPVTRFAFDPATFFLTNDRDDLDFTVIALGERIDGNGDIAGFGFCPLIPSDDKHALGDFVNIVQHPEGAFKQLVIRENRLVARSDTVLHYVADTTGGTSGSPVLNDEWEVVALHHWGGPHRERLNDDPGNDVNEGIRISAIIRELATTAPTLDPPRRALLEAALNSGTRQPVHAPAPETAVPAIIEPDRREDMAIDTLKPAAVEGDAATLTIPLTISLRLGAPAPAVRPEVEVAPPPAGVAENIAPDEDYANRSGFDPKFLKGFDLPLPTLVDEALGKRAENTDATGEDDPYELKYEHFSIVMNAKRRMAYVTAVNIDGKTWVNINRKNGASESAESAETWYADPRIADEDQTDQSLYGVPKRGQDKRFDRGHLVRRQDPAWGTPTRARRGDSDTFHRTNCTPQEWRFNEQTKYWQGIEKYVLERGAVEEKRRLIVYTGPVFGKNDPEYRGVLVPLQFWKIVVRVDPGKKLCATALMAPQKDLIEEHGLPENLNDISKVAEYQTTVKEIERLTHLDFGVLRDHDTFAGEESAVPRMAIGRFEDIAI